MRVSIDGGIHWTHVNELRVDIPLSEGQENILLNFTGEGLIADLWSNTGVEDTAGVPTENLVDFFFDNA